MNKKYSHLYLVCILMSFVVSFAFGLDIYIPILPQMTEIFFTTPSLVQLTMSLFLFTIAIGQLIIGPLSDQFGRKPLLYYSSTLFAVGSLACAFSPTIWLLIISRMLAGFGACGMLVTSFAIVRDLLPTEECAKMYSFLNGAIGISPTFAPILGGYLAVYLGWKSVFFFLCALGVYSLVVTHYCITETLDRDKRAKVDMYLFKRYLDIYKNRQFLTYTAISGFSQAVFFGFFSISPFIIIEILGVSTEQFGYYFAIFGLVLCLGGLASGKIIEKVGMHITLVLGMCLMLGGGILMLGWAFVADMSLLSFLLPMAVACTGGIFMLGSAASLALEPFSETAGTAAAAFGCLEFGLCSTIGTFLMLFPVESPIPYGLCIFCLSILSALLYLKQELQVTVSLKQKIFN